MWAFSWCLPKSSEHTVHYLGIAHCIMNCLSLVSIWSIWHFPFQLASHLSDQAETLHKYSRRRFMSVSEKTDIFAVSKFWNKIIQLNIIAINVRFNRYLSNNTGLRDTSLLLVTQPICDPFLCTLSLMLGCFDFSNKCSRETLLNASEEINHTQLVVTSWATVVTEDN